MAEAVGDPAACFDPADPKATARPLQRVLSDGKLRNLLATTQADRLRTRTWGGLAEKALSFLAGPGKVAAREPAPASVE